MLPLVQTIHTSFRLSPPATWQIRNDCGLMHEVHFGGSERMPLLATEVVAIHSDIDFTNEYPRDEPRSPSISLNLPRKNPDWNWCGKINIPHPDFSKCRTLKAPDKFNPGWKVWIDPRTGEELMRVNTNFLHPEDL